MPLQTQCVKLDEESTWKGVRSELNFWKSEMGSVLDALICYAPSMI